MKVKFLTRSAGPGGLIVPGDIVEVPQKEGELLIRGKYAEAAPAPRAEAQAIAKEAAASEGGQDQVETHLISKEPSANTGEKRKKR